jgi:hypothetical protein
MDPTGDFMITKPGPSGRLGTLIPKASEVRMLETVLETSRELDTMEVEEALMNRK